ncbi:hypothetical protein VTJ49DRAFT_4456 [Mycothermus thermophilus]|uniref:Uncharacterized protein n=1 Tax=Humicola insolens TaxID=85995 RepID=A0ABR3VLV0_HUMIN
MTAQMTKPSRAQRHQKTGVRSLRPRSAHEPTAQPEVHQHETTASCTVPLLRGNGHNAALVLCFSAQSRINLQLFI